MEADIKSYFLKESENPVDEQSDTFSIPLSIFVYRFKEKYAKEATQFTDLARKFLKITKENVQIADKSVSKTFLVWDKK